MGRKSSVRPWSLKAQIRRQREETWRAVEDEYITSRSPVDLSRLQSRQTCSYVTVQVGKQIT